MKNPVFALLLLLAFISCGEEKEKAEETYQEIIEEPGEAEKPGARLFWENLKGYCGKAFEGEVIKAPVNDEFRGKKLVMHLLSCENDFILIPFNVGEDRSRTWVLNYKENNRIELKHDHRKEDGSNDEITLYGGTSTNSGLADIQMFPADEETLELIPAASTNVWWITLKDSVYTYNLRRLGTDREFTVSFDLRKEVPIPEPSWGWEN